MDFALRIYYISDIVSIVFVLFSMEFIYLTVFSKRAYWLPDLRWMGADRETNTR